MSEKPSDPTFLSPKEFGRRSGLSLATVYRYLANGLIPFRQPAGKRGRTLIPINALSVPPEVTGQAPEIRNEEKPKLPGPQPKWTKKLPPEE